MEFAWPLLQRGGLRLFGALKRWQWRFTGAANDGRANHRSPERGLFEGFRLRLTLTLYITLASREPLDNLIHLLVIHLLVFHAREQTPRKDWSGAPC